jgi:hypothetical protein
MRFPTDFHFLKIKAIASFILYKHSGNTYDLTIRFRMLFEECLKKSVPQNLIPKKPQGNLGKGE